MPFQIPDWKDRWQDAYDDALDRGRSEDGAAQDAQTAIADHYAALIDKARDRMKERA